MLERIEVTEQDVSFYFKGDPTPRSVREYRNGTKTRNILEEIVRLVDDLDVVLGAGSW